MRSQAKRFASYPRVACEEGCDLAENNLATSEMLGDQAGNERLEGFAGFWKYETLSGLFPVELEAGRESGNPNLPDGSVGSENKFGGWLLKTDVEDTVLFFHLKVGIRFRKDERFFQGFQSVIRVAPKGDFVKHGASVSIFPLHRMHIEWTY